MKKVPEMNLVVEVAGTPVKGVVDTGSSCSLIGVEVASDLHLNVEEEDVSGLVAANHSEMEVLGSVVVQVGLGGEYLDQKLFVVEALTDSMLLGLDFLSQRKVDIHCGSGKLSVDGKSLDKWGEEVVARAPIRCPSRSEAFTCIRRVMEKRTVLFRPAEISRIKVAASLHHLHRQFR